MHILQVLYYKHSLNASYLGYNLHIAKIISGDIVYDLGAMIRSLRKERKITQKQLGDLLGVSEGTVSKYEANVSLPPFETMRSIASIFNVSMDTLCGMKYQGVVSVHGLTERQVTIIQDLSNIFRSQNTAGKSLSVEQYSILGQIVEEMTK